MYGVEEAVMIENIYWWVAHNKANNKHFYEGRYWTFNTQSAFTDLFPFWSRRQVQRVLDNCQKLGAILVGNFNKSGYNRTNWYALSDDVTAIYVVENLQSTKQGNALPQTVQSTDPNGAIQSTEPCTPLNGMGQYTDINTYINTNVNTVERNALAFLASEYPSDYERFLMQYKTRLGAGFEDFEKSFNNKVEIEVENNKLSWTRNALFARARNFADNWIKNDYGGAAKAGQNVEQTKPAYMNKKLT